MNRFDEAAEQFNIQVECAKEAGIFDAFFLAFGTLLGYCREGGLIKHDSDMDVGIISSMITIEQEKDFLKLLKDKGLYEYRCRIQKNPVNGRLFWTSIRKHPKGHGLKCCHWFWFEHAGYLWHHKGQEALIKGIPSEFLKVGQVVDFLGTKVHIPLMSGSALDFWYYDWPTPRKGGNSSKKVLMNVRDWNDTDTWRITYPYM